MSEHTRVCPHCAGTLPPENTRRLRHPCFDDVHHGIIKKHNGRDTLWLLPRMIWRILECFRDRCERVVPVGFLAEYAATDSADGGDVSSIRVQLHRVRSALVGTPFTIANFPGVGYGLYPIDKVMITKAGSRSRTYRLAAPVRKVSSDWAWHNP